MIGLDSYSRQVFIYLTPFWFISVFESTAYLKFAKLQYVSSGFVAGWLQGHWWGFISRNYVVWPTFFLMNVFIALKGSHFWFYIHPRVLKELATELGPAFAHLFQQSIDTGEIPKEGSLANICTLFRKSDGSLACKYHSVSLTCVPWKLLKYHGSSWWI